MLEFRADFRSTPAPSHRASHLMKESHTVDLQVVGTDIERVIATQEQIASKVAELAARVDKD